MSTTPTDYHPEMISDLKLIIGTIVTILVSLVGTLYYNLKSTNTRLQEVQDVDRDKIQINAVDIEKLKKDIESIREWVVDIERDVDTGQVRQLQDHETLHVIQTIIESIKIHHKHQHNEDL
jgi:hypothetical protein